MAEVVLRIVILWLCAVGASAQFIYRQDRLGTLRTFQVASCDGDELRLECPPDTTVSINLVQYGRLASKPDLCGHPRDMEWVNNTDCMDRNALKVVIAECGGKQSCRLQTSPKAFGVDPCPGIRKFVEVLYKCQPSLFRSEVVCQGERRKISCDRSRIAIYSASFGVTEHGSIQCLQAPGVKITNCQASFTSEKMINQCQGRESCELNADPAFFNRPCPADHNTYLKVTYTCVPKKILREQYDQEDEEARQNATEVPPADRHLPSGKDAPSTPRSGKTGRGRGAPHYDGVQGDTSSRPARPAASPPPPLPPPLAEEDCNDTEPMTAGQRHVIGFITEWITAYRFVSGLSESI
ncbi:L-rhamnose-binding lectin CSL3-like [Pollicipes pollicipes]|uniref:L-rhamnose-binding lectin CSL3-like n=1 Tax=Pollicipes pollicipes TaxID=41117 RepID=UPI0018856897|nr:L-rhamnose-binding lectin CSL3-like [Pollicipes pollicipes]